MRAREMEGLEEEVTMVNVAILGYGVVGSGVAEVMATNWAKIAKSAACEIRLKYILDVRDFAQSPFGGVFVKDFSVIEQDPEVQVVVEAIGGAGAAYEFTKRSLLAGKSVVTSNKELVSARGFELLGLAKEKNVNYLFEASVGGGVPIIRPLSQCLAANEIDEIYGILNGTTNYILTSMIRQGLSFEDALAAAREKGYVEQSPAADIEGIDACRKICILSSLAFGKHMYPDYVPTEGISKISLTDVKNARRMGYKIKLLGRAQRQPCGKVAAYVAPHWVGNENLLSGVEGVFNGIFVKGNAIGDVMFYGQGAGKMPTASAVVADLIDAVKHVKSRKYLDWEQGSAEDVFDPALLPFRWYVRCEADRQKIKELFGTVEFVPESGDAAFVTGYLCERELTPLLEKAQAGFACRIFESV